MKKLMLTAIIAVIAMVSVNAQSDFGVKAGVNLATISGDDVGNVDGRTSFHIGGVVEFKISEKFSFQPGLLYSAQGAESSDEEFGGQEKIELDYLNLPLIAKYYVTEGLSFEAGPQIGFLLSSKYIYELEGSEVSEDLKDETNSIDFGINLGLGYKLESGLNFGASYNIGMSDVFEEGDGDVKNAVFQISLGYFF